MKTIGLIGGLSWESSAEYYRVINELVGKRLGALHSARSLLFSFDFNEIETLQQRGEWDTATDYMIDAAQALERGGAEVLLICSNTMHRMAGEVQKHISIPLLHIVDATATCVLAHGIQKVGLLGTKYTMEQDFYRGRLEQQYALEVLVPHEEERQLVHDVIYNELCHGVIRPESKQQYKAVMRNLVNRGSEGLILGCTEIMLLVQQGDAPVPVFDTTALHAQAAVDYALAP